MSANPPLWTVIGQIVTHTPSYAWLILLVLIALGARQWRDHVITRARLAMAPIGLGAYSLWGATATFGARADVIAAWVAGTLLAIAANRWLRWPREVRADGDGRYAVTGSPWPLVVMLAVFALRYSVAVTLAFHRDWASDLAFGLSMALVYGAVSGLFAARALRILRSAPSVSRLAAA